MFSIKNFGLGLFILAMTLFVSLLFIGRYDVTNSGLERFTEELGDRYPQELQVELEALKGEGTYSKWEFQKKLVMATEAANQALAETYTLSPDLLDRVTQAMRSDSTLSITPESRAAGLAILPPAMQKTVGDYTKWLEGKSYDTPEAFDKKVKAGVEKASAAFLRRQKISSGSVKDLKFQASKIMGTGFYWDNQGWFFILIILGGALGALMYIFPAYFDGMPGIKHNGIYHSSATSRGLIGIIVSIFLVSFYVLLYFYHYLIVEWISLVDPVAMALTGGPASQWFMYGFLYTVSILVMGIRMLGKYRHSRYHQVRTVSVMFFQVAFAFIIPEILVLLNQPYMDLKNSWPLNYTFFFDYNVNGHIQAGTFGLWMLGWGIGLTAIGVPTFTYFFGKRWYCSWVCGCGGLAETLGDPYRQLSDKTTESWQIERVLIHGVLVFAVIMTGLVLYSLFGGDFILKINQWVLFGIFSMVGFGLYGWHRRKYPHLKGNKVLWTVMSVLALIAGVILVKDLLNYSFFGQGQTLSVTSYQVRSIYGFAIGSIFAGVVGTGLYPILGNRPWCRFGCPLAAYLGLVQRFQSRFRITTNGGQCISCGNCSTYCEMGIDVRAYAQRGQNIVRSSCVGCGVCAAVCPRGVLSLENNDNTGSSRMDEVRY